MPFSLLYMFEGAPSNLRSATKENRDHGVVTLAA
jgi:hypothetical protein